MKYVKKANKLDVILSKKENILIGLPFTLMGTSFLIAMINNLQDHFIELILMIAFCSIFIIIGLVFSYSFIKLLVLVLFKDIHKSYYIVTEHIQAGAISGTPSRIEKHLKQGNEIGLPNWDKLSSKDISLMDSGEYLLNNFNSIDQFKHDILETSKTKENNLARYNYENSMTEKKEFDPFDVDECKYNIDADDPFADFYKKK